MEYDFLTWYNVVRAAIAYTIGIKNQKICGMISKKVL